MPDTLTDLLAKVENETTFIRFLSALRPDSEASGHDCESRYADYLPEDHWQTRSTTKFLRAVEDWASRGDFADGVHHGEPMLRRVATMLYVGKYLRHEDYPPR